MVRPKLAISWLTTNLLLSACMMAGRSTGADDGVSSAGLGDDDGNQGGDGDGHDDAGDGDGDGDGQPPPPEEEEEADFRVPRASGRFVYTASETTDRVAVIDSSTLAISVVTVGREPTVVTPIPGAADEAGAVAVLCGGSSEIAFVRTDAGGATTVEMRPGNAAANEVVSTPDGALVIAYHRAGGPEVPGAASSQELTIVEVDGDGRWEMAVGANPRALELTADGALAYVVTDDGVNVIDLGALDGLDKPDVIPVSPDTAIDPSTLEVHISSTTHQALARVDGETWIAVTDLDTAERTLIELPGFVTDLDVAADGSFALATLPAAGGSTLVEIDLMLTAPEPVPHPVPGEYVGLTSLAPSGDRAILYTTVDPFQGALPDPRQRITIARRSADGWTDLTTVFVEVPVRSVGIAPDDANAILLHAEAPELNPHARWPYTLLDLTAAFPIKKLQTAQAEPGPILFTPDGGRSVVVLRDDASDVRRVDMVDLSSFIVTGIQLGSPPEGVGHVEVTDKLFVSQEHPSGRITFIAPDAALQTVTGYELNDSVKD
jgi:DNA-binding beta-propeller fold protein YncE